MAGWQQRRAEFTRGDRQYRNRGTLRKPVAPAHRKTNIRAKRPTRPYIPPARARDRSSQFYDDIRSQEGINTSKHPDREYQPGVAKPRSYGSGSAQDAHAYGSADCNGDTKTNAEDAAQAVPII